MAARPRPPSACWILFAAFASGAYGAGKFERELHDNVNTLIRALITES
jgi:hypothetical protein